MPKQEELESYLKSTLQLTLNHGVEVKNTNTLHWTVMASIKVNWILLWTWLGMWSLEFWNTWTRPSSMITSTSEVTRLTKIVGQVGKPSKYGWDKITSVPMTSWRFTLESSKRKHGEPSHRRRRSFTGLIQMWTCQLMKMMWFNGGERALHSANLQAERIQSSSRLMTKPTSTSVLEILTANHQDLSKTGRLLTASIPKCRM